MSTAVVVLAAGKGTRMKSGKPKVLHSVAKLPMLGHVINAGLAANPEKTIIIFSHQDVANYASEHYPKNTICVEQEHQLGTAHAVIIAEEELENIDGDILILCGDVPLIDAELIERFIASHESQNNAITFISVFAENPAGLGRVIRDDKDEVLEIVEHKDASEEQRKINEINTGIYIAKSEVLFELLHKIDNKNTQEEYYITDLISLGLANGHPVGTFTAEDADALSGVNSRLQLACMEDMLQNIKREEFMDEGVTFIDPQSVFFAYDTKIGHDVEIGPNVQFGEGVRIESDVVIEGNCFISKTYINEGVTIKSFCHLDDAEIHEGATIGPFARLRPGAEIGDNSKIGSFVEIKNSIIGNESAASHLSYIGDAKIGNKVNIGAGTIVANYDGANKHKTIIGDDVFIGSGTTLVAPVTVEDGATTAANSIITKNVTSNTLVISKVARVDRRNYTRPVKQKG